MTPPFADALMPEVVARVAVAMIVREYNNMAFRDLSGPAVVQLAIERFPAGDACLTVTCLRCIQYHLIARVRLADWKREAIHASRLGYGFRRCWYADYKANRR